MRPLNRRTRSCTYTVAIDGGMSVEELQSLAQYLATLAAADCEALVFDCAPPDVVESRRSVMRWVARYLPATPEYLLPDGGMDLLHAAADHSTTEKIIIGTPETRYAVPDVQATCELLDRHDVVEPEEYVEPMPWWGGVEAGGMLLHRGVDQAPERRTTFGFRRSSFRPLAGAIERRRDSRRLALLGADVCEARQLFVRREPSSLPRWLGSRLEAASVAGRGVFFALLPLLIVLAAVGGMQIAAGYAGVIAFASVVLAVRGRMGASHCFPLRACLFAPIWIAERSVSVYGALFARLRGSGTVPTNGAAARTHRAASGE